MALRKVGQLPDPPRRTVKSRSEDWYKELSLDPGEWYELHVQEDGQTESSARSKRNSLHQWALTRGLPLELAERKIDGKKHFFAMVPKDDNATIVILDST